MTQEIPLGTPVMVVLHLLDIGVLRLLSSNTWNEWNGYRIRSEEMEEGE